MEVDFWKVDELFGLVNYNLLCEPLNERELQLSAGTIASAKRPLRVLKATPRPLILAPCLRERPKHLPHTRPYASSFTQHQKEEKGIWCRSGLWTQGHPVANACRRPAAGHKGDFSAPPVCA